MRDQDDDRGPRGDFRQGPPAPGSRGSAYREFDVRDARRPPMRPGFPPPPPPPRLSRAEREMREMEDFLFGPRNRGANVPPRPRADAGTPDGDAASGLPGDERQADAS
jgi:hypothetical protein